MRILNAMGVAGLLLFLAGGSLEAEPGRHSNGYRTRRCARVFC